MSSGEELAGSIIITSVNSVSMHITPFFGKFQQKYPNIHLNYGSNTQIAKLEYGEAHISLRYGAKPTEPDYIVQNLIQLPATRIGRINALFTQVQQLWTAVDSFDTPAMQPNPADGEPATLKIYPPLSH